jgi:glycosyltransferase involved in cell wall biosynthesis
MPAVAERAKPLRIALATSAIVRGDGQGRVNYEIAMRAANAGHEVTVLATRVDADVAAHERIRVVRWNIFNVPTSLIRQQLASYLVGGWLRKHRNDFDIVHVNGGFTLAESDVNTTHFVHDAWLRSPVHTSRIRKGLPALYYRGLTRLNQIQEAAAFRKAHVVVAISARVREQLLASGVDPSKIALIANGVDVDEFSPGPSLRAELGLPADKPLILFAGDMTTPRKNLDGVLRAVRALPDVHVVVVGSLRKNPYPAMAQQLGLSERVHFLGWRKDLDRIMRSVDAFVFPSRYEACSLVMLEALASGLPVVTAVTAGGAEIVAEAGGIVLDDPERVDLLERAIAKLCSDRAARRALAESARRTAIRYSWEEMTDKYLALYQEHVESKLGKVTSR